MGLYDREYTRHDFKGSYGRAARVSFGGSRLTPIVKLLLIINITVFVLQRIGAENFLVTWFSVLPVNLTVSLQIWRLIGYQFLHGGFGHIFFNMFALFFFGPVLERQWPGKKFIVFYLLCGVTGGVFYTILALTGFLEVGPMVGASGAILGLVGACAVLFPQMKVIAFPIFIPISIRYIAIGFSVIYTIIVVTKGQNAGGEAAHLAGMATGALYAAWPIVRLRLKFKTKSRARIFNARWEEPGNEKNKLNDEVDRILKKVHNSGIHSLNRREKNILQEATKLQQQDKI